CRRAAEPNQAPAHVPIKIAATSADEPVRVALTCSSTIGRTLTAVAAASAPHAATKMASNARVASVRAASARPPRASHTSHALANTHSVAVQPKRGSRTPSQTTYPAHAPNAKAANVVFDRDEMRVSAKAGNS